MSAVLLVILVVVVVLAAEALWHRVSRDKIPIRIHVNGIRGKSSVARLISAGLRAGGMRTWAKVTGTLPNVIDEHGEDIPIVRGAAPSIIEQRAVIAEAAAAQVQAVVLECMALEPAFQRAEESLIRPTISVITNVRLDHEEVFGSSIRDVALALCNTIPRRGVLVTTDGEAVPLLREVAARRGTSVVVVDTRDLPDSLTEGFSYLEHKDNVALALAVCREAGVADEVSIAGMRACAGDPGALRILRCSRGGKTLSLVNAMAANDPQSTLLVYQRTIVAGEFSGPVLILVNSRKDRPLRSRQMGALLPRLPARRYFLSGDDALSVRKSALRSGVPAEALVSIDARSGDEVVETLFAAVEHEGVVFAIGNIAGLGLEIARIFSAKDPA